MSKELGIEPAELINNYCELYVKEKSIFPILRLNPITDTGMCPMLKDNKCIVQNAKPTVCAMYPIGRLLLAPNGKHEKLSTKDILYIYMQLDCGNDSETHTVREWFQTFNIPLEDEFFVKWQETILKIDSILEEGKKAGFFIFFLC